MYHPYLIRLRDIISGQFSAGSLQSRSFAVSESLSKIVLRCYAEPMESRDIDDGDVYFKDYKHIELQYIQSLKNGWFVLLNDLLGSQDIDNKLDEIKDVSKEDHLFICRVLFYSDYSEDKLLKRLSPELRFIH